MCTIVPLHHINDGIAVNRWAEGASTTVDIVLVTALTAVGVGLVRLRGPGC
jgi:hypothetical protein